MATKRSAGPSSSSAAAAASLDVQHQIRTNAAQLQDYFSDLYSWEKAVTQEDEARRKACATAAQATAEATRATRAPRARQSGVATTGGLSSSSSSGGDAAAVEAKQSKRVEPAAHTHDKGYNKWTKFDVEAALREADEDEAPKAVVSSTAGNTPVTPVKQTAASRSSPGSDAAADTAASLKKSREEIEREEGNAHYQRGDYVAAIKCYTRCLGYNMKNAVVLSNRAMAYLKNREFGKAEDDCNLALQLDPSHLKSLSRRATARNALGKHRLALLDFERAAELDPKSSSRQLQNQIAATKELMRTAIKRAPRRTQFKIEVIGSADTAADATKTSPEPKRAKMAIQEDDEESAENKENAAGNRVAVAKTLSPTRRALSNKPVPPSQPMPEPPAKNATPVLPEASQPAVAASPPPPPASSTVVIVPKLPKKAPATSYEFGRVWKTLGLKGDSERRQLLLKLRAEYLQLIEPSRLGTIFKNSIESDILCEAFHVFRHVMLSENNVDATASQAAQEGGTRFVLRFAQELTKVPRFSMVVMFLSEREKEDVAWVVQHLTLRAESDGDESQVSEVESLKKLYELS